MYQCMRGTPLLTSHYPLNTHHLCPILVAWEGDMNTRYYRPLNVSIHPPLDAEAAIYVAAHLRPDDYREVTEGHGVYPIRAAWRP